jgi:RNA polymerase sigma-70 factor (ECF subfamily)
MERFYISADATQWNRFQNGNEQAFSQIFHTHFKNLCHYGYKFIPDKDLVKDCVQELFIYLWQNRERLEYTEAIELYLLKSLRGRLLRLLNKRKKSGIESIFTDTVSFSFTFSFAETSQTEQIRNTQEEQLLQALNQLPARQKEVVYLRFFRNLSYEEIAAIMGLNNQIVRNYACQAIKGLRKKVELIFFVLLLCQYAES